MRLTKTRGYLCYIQKRSNIGFNLQNQKVDNCKALCSGLKLKKNDFIKKNHKSNTLFFIFWNSTILDILGQNQNLTKADKGLYIIVKFKINGVCKYASFTSWKKRLILSPEIRFEFVGWCQRNNYITVFIAVVSVRVLLSLAG